MPSEPDRSVLIIDDEPQIRRLVKNALERDGLRVIEASTGAAGVDLAAAEQPALVILDLGLPDRNGLDVCRDLRAFTAAPIIVLSARTREAEKIALLDAGADDYLTKPFGTGELQARVRAQLRRRSDESLPQNSQIVVGELTIDLARRTVQRNGQLVHLTPTEWDLLRTFAAHPDHTLTHQQLFRAVWGNGHGDAQQHLRVYVGQLRRKIETDPVRPRFIKTEAGVGYRFQTTE
jgi:two-component system KDP operon response regulator KdpE